MAEPAFASPGGLSAEEERNVGVVLRLNTMVNDGDFDAMDQLFAADYADHNPGWQISSLDELKALIRAGREAFHLHNEIDWVIASGDKVFIRVLNHGEHAATVFGRPPSGRETCMTTFEIYRFSERRIAERWVMSDVIGLMRQVGAEVPVTLP